jgi:feruloyl esterase
MGRERAEAFERLYLLPGVYHCSGGEGPSLVDLLTPMIDWVEKGVAPDAIVARSSGPGQARGFGRPAGPLPGARASAADDARAPAAGGRSRPVYPYPFVARYDGTGDPDSASSYVRAARSVQPRVPAWAGSDFYRPYAPTSLAAP